MKGFSAIEVIIVVSVIGILAIFAITTFSAYRENQNLTGSVQELLSLIHEARQNTLSSLDASSYGVHFETGQATYFKGNVYSSIDPNNKVVILPNGIEVSDISLVGGVSDIIFARLTGEVAAFGSITIRSIADTTKLRIIKISQSGIASQ